VIKSIAPDIPLRGVIWSMMQFVVPMIFAVIVLCMFSGIATGLADAALGR
jgi:C4-dicarboxylate transporter DctM subunit